MGSTNYKIVKNFITEGEKKSILNWLETLNHMGNDANAHMKRLSNKLRGKSFIFNQSQTKLTDYITNFQSISEVSVEESPEFITVIQRRIAQEFQLPMDNIFFQIVDMEKGGLIDHHYDASLSGYINYKCNVSVLSDTFTFHIDNDNLTIEEGDVYGFEASLYRHWTDEFTRRRVFLSFGFIVPYHITGRTEDEPRVRLSKRIQKWFQTDPH